MKCKEELENEEQHDCFALLSIFPEEIWECILLELREPQDLLNCATASKYFGAIAQPLKKHILFQEVLKILDKNQYINKSDLPDILSWRLVCSSWKNAVNHLLEFRPYHTICASPSELSSGCVISQAQWDLAFPTFFRIYTYDLEKLETQIIPAVTKSKSNCPVPSRHLELIESNIYEQANQLRIDPEQAAKNYHVIIKRFLTEVGHHFWHAVISYGMFSDNMNEWCMQLKHYVELMPNLRSLYIVYNVPLRIWSDNSSVNNRAKECFSFPRLQVLKLLTMFRSL